MHKHKKKVKKKETEEVKDENFKEGDLVGTEDGSFTGTIIGMKTHSNGEMQITAKDEDGKILTFKKGDIVLMEHAEVDEETEVEEEERKED